MARVGTQNARCSHRRRDERWRPPHCPNSDCRWHTVSDTSDWRVQRRGARTSRRDPLHPNQRFRCTHCSRWFCRSAFTLNYWKKVSRLAERAYPLLNNAGGLRQAGRVLGLSVTTLQRVQRLLAGQSLLFQLTQEQRLAGQLAEPLALDGQRNLVNSVHQMAEVTGLFTTESGYTLELEAFGIRQGVGQDRQRLQRRAASESAWGRPDPRNRERSVRRLLRRVERLLRPAQEVELRTDEEPDYAAPIREWGRRRRVRHVRVSSRARRDGSNVLWMANHKHRLQRHSLANLRRQTIAQSKRLAGLQDRLLIHRVWLNVTKGVSERTARGRRETPAMKLGLESRPLGGRELFAQRRFPARCGLPEELRPLYEGRIRGWPKEVLGGRILKYAY